MHNFSVCEVDFIALLFFCMVLMNDVYRIKPRFYSFYFAIYNAAARGCVELSPLSSFYSTFLLTIGDIE